MKIANYIKITTFLIVAMLVNAVVAEDISDALFIDQINGMTRLARLEVGFSVEMVNGIGDDGISDKLFVEQMLSSTATQRLVNVAGLGRSAAATGGKARWLKTMRRTIAPSGFFRLCRDKLLTVCDKSRGDYSVDDAGQMLMNTRLFAELLQVNLWVNDKMQAEYEQIGTRDNWQVNLSNGDCEDFALTKKSMLMARGWPSDALRVSIVDTEWGERHAVLNIATRNGDYILDNLTDKIINVELSEYSFLSRQDIIGKYSWVLLG